MYQSVYCHRHHDHRGGVVLGHLLRQLRGHRPAVRDGGEGRRGATADGHRAGPGGRGAGGSGGHDLRVARRVVRPHHACGGARRVRDRRVGHDRDAAGQDRRGAGRSRPAARHQRLHRAVAGAWACACLGCVVATALPRFGTAAGVKSARKDVAACDRWPTFR